MPVYVSMLRGINVGPHKRIKMEKLRQSFEGLGFQQVATYIQSGNVVFKTAKSSSSPLSKKIEERLLEDFGFSIQVVSRTAEEMIATVAGNPFVKQSGIDAERLHVMFLSDIPAAVGLKKFSELTTPPEQLHCAGKAIYLYLPNGAGESKLMRAPLDRILSATATARNWRTVNQLAQMCRDCA